MHIIRHIILSVATTAFVLFLFQNTADAQTPPPSYRFLEVMDETGKPVSDARVETFLRGYEKSNSVQYTNINGIVERLLIRSENGFTYRFKISKPGYFIYEDLSVPTEIMQSENPHQEDLFKEYKESSKTPIKVELLKITASGQRKVEAKQRQRELIFAAQKGDAGTLEKLIITGADVNATDKYGISVISWAAASGNVETINTLIEAGAKNHKSGRTLLHFLSNFDGCGADITEAKKNSTKFLVDQVVKKLIKAGDDLNATYLIGKGSIVTSAVNLTPQCMTLETLEYLVKSGAQINVPDLAGQTALMIAIRTTAMALAKEQAKEESARFDNSKTVLRADNFDEMALIRKLIALDADVNARDKYGETVLVKAARGISLNVVRQLLEAGADVKSPDLYAKALWFSKHPEIIRELIAAGGNPNLKDSDGRNVLMNVVGSGQLEVVKQLLLAGADVNAQDNNGNSVLMIGVEFGCSWQCLEVWKTLIDAGTDLHLSNNKGETALSIAKRADNKQIIKMLESAGATF